MKNKLFVLLALTFLSTLNSQLSTLHAQGAAFTYQGRLNDGAGPANGSYDLTFSVWDAASGPAQVGGTLTNAATAVSNGLFTVALDFGAGIFPGADRFLEIGVRTNGGGAFTNLSPRQQITSTPYAIQSANAAVATSVSGSVSAAQLTGTLAPANIGAGTITGTMLATGSVTSVQLSDGAVTLDKLSSVVANSLSITFTNPTPVVGDIFGYAVTAVGTDKVLIGTPQDNTGANNAGAAYLFSTSGTLLTTFTNPTPVLEDQFGHAVAAVGADKVLIGAYLDNTGASDAGAAYLFSTSGTLLTTFTNPTPANSDSFGNSVAAVGTDKVLIGAVFDDTGATDAGAAYLFSTSGTLLTTFTNPTPASADQFGFTLAAVGTDRVIIGAYLDDTGATDTGAAYLFSTSGTLLSTFTNPTPVASDQFGYAVAAVGTDKVLIGADFDDTGLDNAGAAYLFSFSSTLFVPGLISEGVIDGAVTDAKISSVDAAKITSGTLADARLSTNVALLNRSPQTFGGTNVFSGKVDIGSGGTLLQSVICTNAILDFGATTNGGTASLTITVTGAGDGDVVSLGVPNANVVALTSYSAWASGVGEVTVRFTNNSGATLNLASGTFRVCVIKF